MYKDCYRPQTKFPKVMFSQVFVCPQGGLCLCPRGGLRSLSGGVSVRGGVLRGLCPGGGEVCVQGEGSLCPGEGGLCPGEGGLCPGEVGLYPGEGSLSRGGGLCPEGSLSRAGSLSKGSLFRGGLPDRDPPYGNERAVCMLLEFLFA